MLLIDILEGHHHLSKHSKIDIFFQVSDGVRVELPPQRQNSIDLCLDLLVKLLLHLDFLLFALAVVRVPLDIGDLHLLLVGPYVQLFLLLMSSGVSQPSPKITLTVWYRLLPSSFRTNLLTFLSLKLLP